MAVASGYADVAGEEIQVFYFCFARKKINPKAHYLIKQEFKCPSVKVQSIPKKVQDYGPKTLVQKGPKT